MRRLPHHTHYHDDTDEAASVMPHTQKGRHPIYDGLGDRQWHSGVVADRADVAALLFPCRATAGAK